MVINRQRGLDSLAGILIIYMILYHCIQHAGLQDSVLYDILHRFFFFFMAWFYYKAGMFHRKKTVKEVVLSSAKRLLKPYVFFTLIAHLCCCLNYLVSGDYDIIHYTLSPFKQILLFEATNWNLPLWFLISLFVVKNIFNMWILRFNPKVLFIVGIVAWQTSHDSLIYPIFIQNIALGLFFYTCGNCFGRLKFSKWLILVFGVVYIWALFNPSHVDFRANIVGNNTCYLQWLLVSLMAIVLYNNMFENAPRILLNNMFVCIGENSMFFYCTHWIIIMIIKAILTNANVDMSALQLLVIFVCLEIFILSFLFKVIPQTLKIKIGI